MAKAYKAKQEKKPYETNGRKNQQQHLKYQHIWFTEWFCFSLLLPSANYIG